MISHELSTSSGVSLAYMLIGSFSEPLSGDFMGRFKRFEGGYDGMNDGGCYRRDSLHVGRSAQEFGRVEIAYSWS